MNRFFKWLAIVFVVCAPPRIAWCICDDFQHPERWNNLNHNPYLTLAILGVCLALAVYLGVYVWYVQVRPAQAMPRRHVGKSGAPWAKPVNLDN